MEGVVVRKVASCVFIGIGEFVVAVAELTALVVDFKALGCVVLDFGKGSLGWGVVCDGSEVVEAKMRFNVVREKVVEVGVARGR